VKVTHAFGTAHKLANDSSCRTDTILEIDYGNAGHTIAKTAQEKVHALII